MFFRKNLGLKEASLSPNGWMKLPNGLIIQWGRYTTPSIAAKTNHVTRVLFPIAFTTWVSVYASAGVFTPDYLKPLSPEYIEIRQFASVAMPTLTSVDISLQTELGTASHGRIVGWFAIGY